MNPFTSVVVPLLVVLLAGSATSYGQWKIAKRSTSGSFATADAQTILAGSKTNFEQAQQIRQELRDDIGRLTNQVAGLQAENAALKQEQASMSLRLTVAEEHAAEARDHVRRCEDELARLRGGTKS